MTRHVSPPPRGDDDPPELDALLELLPGADPPPGLLARIEQDIDADDRSKAETTRAPTIAARLRRASLTGFLGGALTGAAAATAMFILSADDKGAVAVLEGGGLDPIRVETIADGAFLRVNRIEPTAERALELWLLPADGGAPQSLGLVARKGAMTILPLTRAPRPGDGIAISLEPPGGSPLSGPSGPVVMQSVFSTSG